MSSTAHPGTRSPRAAHAPDAPEPTPPRLSLTVEADRGQRTHTLIGEAAHSLLVAIGAPPPLARRMSDAATVAAHYLVGHSALSRYRLRVTTDPGGVSLAVTDYIEPSSAGAPAWLPVSHAGHLEPAPVALASLPARGDDDHGLDLHRTADGRLRLAYRGAWAASTPPC
ncbi:hypothetical protein [Streptomyces flavofungini]|uniref:hypothetical protein n=1 Tax=Streptomyces flavofungini TaxID=68200 RepID=UPI0025AF3D7F|nr:hypothetical protein [Streptomyces flavofungini]WJV50761.1 hypothetical protein QUY26_37815 [Streptomyces flavofungini]